MIARHEDATAHRRGNHNRRIATQSIWFGKRAFDDDAEVITVVVVLDTMNAHQRLRRSSVNSIFWQQHRDSVILAVRQIKHCTSNCSVILYRLTPFSTSLNSILCQLFYHILRKWHAQLDMLLRYVAIIIHDFHQKNPPLSLYDRVSRSPR